MIRLLAAGLLFASTPFFAQGVPLRQQAEIPVGVRFVATEANSPPGSCGCFWLRGAGVDAAVPLGHGVSAAFDLAGDTTKQVPGTTRGLSEITLMAGPRYSLPLRRYAAVQAQALFGVARGFDADFIVGAQHTDTASVFSMALGGALDVPVSRRLSVRAVQVDYLHTNLPNGADDRQKNIRLGVGLVYRVRLPHSR